MLSLCKGLWGRLVVSQVMIRFSEIAVLSYNNFTMISCFESNLNGEYHDDPLDNDYYKGIIWELWRGDYSLKSSKMMIRPRAFT